ncbi:MAG: hypothetical protein ACKVTZ_07040 [Bacteroidia bacterium]
MSNRTVITFIFTLFGIFWIMTEMGCNRQRDYIIPTTWQIYPTTAGKYRIYRVSETTYTTAGPQTAEYYVKEEIGAVDTALDNLQRPISQVTSYRSPLLASGYDFTVDRLWAVYKDTTSFLEEIKDGRRYMLLKFPVYAGAQFTWNPFVHIDDSKEEKELYRYISADSSMEVQGNTYEHCVFLQEGDKLEDGKDSVGVTYRKAFSVYAPNVGKVYRYYKRKAYKGSGTNTIDTEKSRTIIEELVEHN